MRLLPALVGVSAALAMTAAAGESPHIPGGIADVDGRTGFFANAGGGIDAVDLTSGTRRWSSSEGQQPLLAHAGLLAVAARDPDRKNRARVRFLNAVDGTLANGAPTVELPDEVILLAPGLSPDRQTPLVALSAWVMPHPNADGRWRIRWESRFTPAYGFRPPSPAETKRSAGVFLIDLRTGSVRAIEDEATPDAAPKLPARMALDTTRVYWGWSDWGAAWSSTPRPLAIGGGVAGAFAYEPRGERRLELLRWSGDAPLPSVMLMSGAEYAPLIPVDGRYALISVQKDKREQMVLLDLARGGNAPPLATLPRLEDGFRMPIAVLNGLLLYVVERPDEAARGPGTTFARSLVAIRYESTKRAWAYPLAPRVEAPPVPGGGMPR